MLNASRELVAWINHTYQEAEPLDISYCQLRPILKSQASAARTVDIDPNPVGINSAPVGLEPSMGSVVIKAQKSKNQNTSESTRATDEALFVYPMASSLVKEHNFKWEDAISRARTMFKQFPNGTAGAKVPIHDGADSDVEDQELDVEARGSAVS